MARREALLCWFWLCLLAACCPPAAATAATAAPGLTAEGSGSVTGADGSTVDFAGRFLPEKIAGLAVGGGIILRSLHTGVRASFESMPCSSALVLMVLDGVFCWTMLSMLWELDSSTLSDLGSWTVGSAYAACSILLFTPLILFVPDQSKSRKTVRSVSQALQGAVKRTFRAHRARMAQVYLVVLALQLAATVSVYQLAASLQQGRAEQMDGLLRIVSSDVGLQDFEELLLPGASVLLYLALAWCSLSAMYERLFESSFVVDFPVGVLHNAFPCCLGEPAGRAPLLSFDDKPVPVPRERLERWKEVKKKHMQEWKEAEKKKARRRKEEEASAQEGQFSVRLESSSMVQLESAPSVVKEDEAPLDNVILIFDALADTWIKNAEGITEEIQQAVQKVDESPRLFCAHYAAYVLYSAVAVTAVVWLGVRLCLLSADLRLGVLVSSVVLLPFFSLLGVFACFGALGAVLDEEDLLEEDLEVEAEAIEQGKEDLLLPSLAVAARAPRAPAPGPVETPQPRRLLQVSAVSAPSPAADRNQASAAPREAFIQDLQGLLRSRAQDLEALSKQVEETRQLGSWAQDLEALADRAVEDFKQLSWRAQELDSARSQTPTPSSGSQAPSWREVVAHCRRRPAESSSRRRGSLPSGEMEVEVGMEALAAVKHVVEVGMEALAGVEHVVEADARQWRQRGAPSPLSDGGPGSARGGGDVGAKAWRGQAPFCTGDIVTALV